MEPDAKPAVEYQRRLIPKMKEVVRNEVLKLLDAGIIYPIAVVDRLVPFIVFPRKEELLLCLMRITRLFLRG
jgi:hypothetical protein